MLYPPGRGPGSTALTITWYWGVDDGDMSWTFEPKAVEPLVAVQALIGALGNLKDYAENQKSLPPEWRDAWVELGRVTIGPPLMSGRGYVRGKDGGAPSGD